MRKFLLDIIRHYKYNLNLIIKMMWRKHAMDKRHLEQFISKFAEKAPELKFIGEYGGAKAYCDVQGACGHIWKIIPSNFFSRGSGMKCPICFNTGTKYSGEVFAERIKYRFGLTMVGKYIDAKTCCTVQGVCGHTWNIIPSNLLSHKNNSSCPTCSAVWSTEQIISLKYLYSEKLLHIDEISTILNKTVEQIRYKAHKEGITRVGRAIRPEEATRFYKIKNILEKLGYYDISEEPVISPNEEKRISYTCDIGHKIFGQLSNNIFSHGRRCPTCSIILNAGSSKGEKELYAFIKESLSEDTWILPNDRSILSNKELDIVLPDIGLAFEYNGIYFHSEEMGKDSHYHLNKLKGVEAFGYRLITITDEEWLSKQDIVKSRLRAILGLNKSIFARKCVLKEITYKECADFCNKNHIQGEAKTSVNLGLFLQDVLVAIMSFSKARFSTEYEYELVRYCCILNNNIIGGASKLLKYFETKYNPESIGSYSDRRWNTGNLYLKLGFNFIHNSEPNYRYYKHGKTHSRQQFMKHKLKELFPNIFSEDKTEKEIMIEAGYTRVYDCGSALFIKTYNK